MIARARCGGWGLHRVTWSPPITGFNKILKDTEQERLHWPEAPTGSGLAPPKMTGHATRLLVPVSNISKRIVTAGTVQTQTRSTAK